MKLSRSFSSYAMLAVLPLALAACGGADDDMDVDPATDPAATPAPEPAAAGMDEMQIPLTAVGGSSVGGEVRIDDEMDGQATKITVHLTGSTAGSVHQGHVHSGTCDAPGSVVAPLDPITIGDDGSGEITVTANLPTATVMNGSHAVVYHEAGGSPGSPVVCAAIPAHTM